jgi:ATP-dependent helicase/nuclease subunit A
LTRLLYVAATRARDMLVVGRWAKTGKSPAAWSAFEPHLSHFSELVVPATVADAVPEAVDLTAAAAARAGRVVEDVHGAAVKASWAATSVTAESKRFPTITAGGGDEVVPDDPTRAITEDTPSRRADAGMAWGSLVHGLLEHAMRFPSATRDDLRRLARWLIVEEPSLVPVIELAIDTVETVKVSERWLAARASSEHHEEAPFSVLVQREGELPIVISGTIDLVFRDDAAWCVVDYKTDVDGGSALAGKYAAQVAAYERAWRAVVKGKVRSDVVAVR